MSEEHEMPESEERSALLAPYLEEAPALKASSGDQVERAVRGQLLSALDEALNGVDEAARRAVYHGLDVMSAHPLLADALAGDADALKVTRRAFLHATLGQSPWSALSERDLSALWYRWVEGLGEGGVAHVESLWVSVPTVSVERWVELGWRELLDQASVALHSTLDTSQNLEQSDVAEGSSARPRLVGARVSGAGKSAHLGYAYRWSLDRELNVEWLTSDDADVNAPLQVLCVDDAHLVGRVGRWRLASALASWRARAHREGLLICWSDDGLPEGLGALLSAEVDALFELNLDEAWSQLEQLPLPDQAGDARWLVDPSPNLMMADRLRLRDLITQPRAQAPRDLVDEVSAYAALIGPLASIRVLSRALELDEEGLRHILNDAGWVELEEHPQGGARFAPPDPLTWRSALLEGGARAHLCAAALMRALTDVYLGAPPLEERAALQRLSALRGRGAYREPNRAPLDLEAAHKTLETLTPALSHEPPSPLVLGTLCGLALDWAQLGPLTGEWDQALRALELGVASARRLRDPQRAAIILFTLGRLALDDGRTTIAGEALTVAADLLAATGRGAESRQALHLLAEVSLLQGDITGGLARLKHVEDAAREASATTDAWRARFRAGQVYARAQQPERALTLWSALRPPRDRDAQAQDQAATPQASRASLALALECAGRLLEMERDGEAWDWLNELSSRSPLGESLFAVAQWRLSGAPPFRALVTQGERARAARDIGEWVAIQRWIALVALDLGDEPLAEGEPSRREAVSVARRGLETAVRVVAGARDRLQLMACYQLLARLYQALEQREASEASMAMSLAWRASLTLPSGQSGDQETDDLAGIELPTPSAKLLRDAEAEVKSLTEQWLTVSMSAVAAQANQKGEDSNEDEPDEVEH